MAHHLSEASPASYAAWQAADAAYQASVTANGDAHATTIAAKKAEQSARVACLKELGHAPRF